MLKFVVDSVDQIPEGLANLYEEKGGKFHLKVEDAVPKSQLNEFRDNNINLLKEKERLATELQKFNGVDLTKYQEALTVKQKLEDQKLLEAGKVDELVEKRVERMRADFNGQTTALNSQIAELQGLNGKISSQLSDVLIDSQIHMAVSEVGKPREGALIDILNRGKSLFKLIEGRPVPIGPDNNPIFGKDGKAPMTFKEWAMGLKESASYLFESAVGGGGQGNRGGGGGSPVKTISAGDSAAFGANLEDIASGKVHVQ